MQAIDFMNIDVEGWEMEVLKSNNWQKYSPTVIAIEIYGSFEDVFSSEAFLFLRDKGYEIIARTSLTAIFKKSS